MPLPTGPKCRIVVAIEFEQRTACVQIHRLRTDEQRELAGRGNIGPAGDRAIEEPQAALARLLPQRDNEVTRQRRALDRERPGACRAQHAVRRSPYPLGGVIVGEHRENRVRVSCGGSRRLGERCTRRHQRRSFVRAPIPNRHLVLGRKQAPGHALSHPPQSDESDLRHVEHAFFDDLGRTTRRESAAVKRHAGAVAGSTLSN